METAFEEVAQGATGGGVGGFGCGAGAAGQGDRPAGAGRVGAATGDGGAVALGALHRFPRPLPGDVGLVWPKHSHQKGAVSGAARCRLWCHTARIKTGRFASICNERAPNWAPFGGQKPNGNPVRVGVSVVRFSVLPSGIKRRGRDSNPGYPHGYSGFQDRCNRPLCHLSGCDTLLEEILWVGSEMSTFWQDSSRTISKSDLTGCKEGGVSFEQIDYGACADHK